MSTNNKAKNIWWLYQGRRVNTQTAASGKLVVIIQVASGQVAKLISGMVTGSASATATLIVEKTDEDSLRQSLIATVAAGVSRQVSLPSIGTSASGHQNVVCSTDFIFGPGEILSSTSDVAVQTETLTVGVTLLLSTPILPTWNTTGSAGTPSLAASTISAANTLQPVLI